MTLDTLAPPVFLQDRLGHWAQHRPDAVAITFGDVSYTWGQWRPRILQLTEALRAAGIKRGERILTFDLNHLAIIELTYAASALGASTVVGNYRLAPSQLAYVLTDSAPKILFYGAELHSVLESANAQTPLPRTIVIGGENNEYESFLASGAVAEASASAAEGVDAAVGETNEEVHPDDTVLIVYTSGTTGTPKGVELTHRNVNMHSVVANHGLGMGPEDVSMVGMPMFHVGGSCYFQVGVYAGAKTIFL